MNAVTGGGAFPAFLSAVVAAAVSGAAVLLGARLRPPVATNHRGLRLPLSLGHAAAGGICLAAVAGAVAVGVAAGSPTRAVWSRAALAAAVAVVFVAGWNDDRQPERIRGLRAHFSALARGRVTSGIVKLAAITAAAYGWAWAAGASGWRLALAGAVVAGSANLWNLFDVAPGRALKFGIVAAVALAIPRPEGPALPVAVVAALLLAPDLRERAMLGDAGSNVIGFGVGAALTAVLPTAGLAVAFAALLLLHWAAETVTLTRAIRGFAPTRWFDDLGRLRPEISA